jgi:hypothetical protein
MKVDYFDINSNNINDITSIYVKDENKDKLTKILASNFTKSLLELDLSDCFYLKGILPISKCKNLKKLKITEELNYNNIDKCLKLEELYIIQKMLILKYSLNLSQLNLLKNIKHIELNYISIDISNFINNNEYLDLPNLNSLNLNNLYSKNELGKILVCLANVKLIN